MSEHTPTDGTSEVFELQETPTPKPGSTLGSYLRFALYGVAALLMGGFVAVQANPELAEYVTAIPGMSQLVGDDGSSCHVCPMSKNASQVTACSSRCESACSCELVASRCCSVATIETLAARPPAPPLAETIELTSTEL